MKGIENLGSSEPVKFMKEAVDDFKKYIGEITGLRHLRPQSIDGTIEALKKFKNEYPNSKAAVFIFYRD